MIISIKVNAQIIMQSIDFESERKDYNKDNKRNSSNYTQISSTKLPCMTFCLSNSYLRLKVPSHVHFGIQKQNLVKIVFDYQFIRK